LLQDLAITDDKTKKGPADTSKVNVPEDYEVRYRTKKFLVAPPSS
jgi:hypothetical protein